MEGGAQIFADALRGDWAIRRVSIGRYMIEQRAVLEAPTEVDSVINPRVKVGYYADCKIDSTIPLSTLPNPDDLLSIRSDSPGKLCLDLDPATQKIQLWHCDASRKQKFMYSITTRTLTLDGLCVTVNKKELLLRTCNGSPEQWFHFDRLLYNYNSTTKKELILTVKKKELKAGARVLHRSEWETQR